MGVIGATTHLNWLNHLVQPLYRRSVARYVAKVPLPWDQGMRMIPTQMMNLNQVMKTTTCSCFQRSALLSWRQCSRLRWMPLVGENNGKAWAFRLQMVKRIWTWLVHCINHSQKYHQSWQRLSQNSETLVRSSRTTGCNCGQDTDQRTNYGAKDKRSSVQRICIQTAIAYLMRKIGPLTRSASGSYGRQAGRQTMAGFWILGNPLQAKLFGFLLCL